MTINELFEKALDIESKYAKQSTLSLHISKSHYNHVTKYKLIHDGNGRSVDTGHGITNIKELLTVFDMGMAAKYRFINETNNEDLDLN